jgi:hypothetical protein
VGILSGHAYSVAVSGDYAYVADYYLGLRVVSISDPAHPAEVGRCPTPDTPYGVAVSGRYVFVADDDSGLRVISVVDPASPVEVGYYETPGYAFGVAVSGDYAYVAAQAAGLQILQFYGGGVEEKASVNVQTANWPTVIRGVLLLPPALLTVSSSLLSVDGRKVMDLHPGANDVSGLGSGVYFCRLQAGGTSESKRVTLVR